MGIFVNSTIPRESVLQEFSSADYEENLNQRLLISMGGEIEIDDKFYDVSDQIWNLDTECVEDDGINVTVIERLSRMTNLDIRNIQDV